MEMGGTNKSNVEGASECRSEETRASGALCLGFVRNGNTLYMWRLLSMQWLYDCRG